MRVLCALLLSTALLGGEPWTRKDKLLEGVFLAATVMDWGQTRDIKHHPNLCEENRLLGRHPSDTTIDTYFATTVLLHALVADRLSGKWRTAWQYTWIGLEVGTVQRNYALGIRLNF